MSELERLADNVLAMERLYDWPSDERFGTPKSIAAELRALDAAGGWRPISEAPQDGRWIMAWCKNAGCPAVLRWDDELGYFMDASGHSFAHPLHFRELPTPPAVAG